MLYYVCDNWINYLVKNIRSTPHLQCQIHFKIKILKSVMLLGETNFEFRDFRFFFEEPKPAPLWLTYASAT